VEEEQMMGAKGRNNERGVAIVLVAIFMAAAVGLVAVVLDVGAFFRDNRHLQSVVDAAAVAGAQQLPTSGTSGAPCPDAVKNAAIAIANQNDPGSARLEYYCWKSSSAQSGFVDQIQVKASKSSTGGLFSSLGIDILKPARDAWAQGSALGAGAYVVPWVVGSGPQCQQPNYTPCLGHWSGPQGTFDYMSFHRFGSCSGNSASGCWTDLSHTSITGALTEAGGGDSSMRTWVRSGYPQLVTVPTTRADYDTEDCSPLDKTSKLCTDTGGHECGHNATPASCVLIQEFQDRAGQIVLVPVFTSKTSSTFNIVGFAVFRLNSNRALVWQPNLTKAGDSHWWLTGEYVANITCLPPPTGGAAPDSEHCYGLAGGGQYFGAKGIRIVK
jgi:hypothetical protein